MADIKKYWGNSKANTFTHLLHMASIRKSNAIYLKPKILQIFIFILFCGTLKGFTKAGKIFK